MSVLSIMFQLYNLLFSKIQQTFFNLFWKLIKEIKKFSRIVIKKKDYARLMLSINIPQILVVWKCM